ncbi:MAG: FtsX-like permease family protein [Campylobacterota bacterium]|nr:FtsX-like permease family protein [Campylobacterota bacterium]
MYDLILKLSIRNRLFNLRDTTLVITMIAVAISMMIALAGLYDGMTASMIESTKRSDSGDISIYAKEYRLNKELKNSIPNAPTLLQDIAKMEGVEASTYRVSVDGLISTAKHSAFASIYGVDLPSEESFGNFSKFLKYGEIRLDKRGVILSVELAKKLKTRIGSKVIFTTQDSSREINSIALKVRGVVQTTNLSLDKNAIWVDREVVANFLNIPSTTATQIAIIASHPTPLFEKLKSDYANLDVKNFLELYPMIKQMQDMMGIFNSISFVIVMLVVFIGIFGVMYVSILKRIREFGIMISIGMNFSTIRLQIITESLILALLGYILGAGLGYAILLYLSTFGLDLGSYATALESFGMNRYMYATVKSAYFTNTFWAIILSAIMSVVIPLQKIKKSKPVDVIKANE